MNASYYKGELLVTAITQEVSFLKLHLESKSLSGGGIIINFPINGTQHADGKLAVGNILGLFAQTQEDGKFPLNLENFTIKVTPTDPVGTPIGEEMVVNVTTPSPTQPPVPQKDEVSPILDRVKALHDEYDKNIHIQMGSQGKAYGDIRDEQEKQLQGLRTSPNLAMATDLLERAEKFIEDAKAEIATRPTLKEVKSKLESINTKIGTLPVAVTDQFKTRAAELTAQYSVITADPNPTKATELLTKVQQLFVDVEMAVRANVPPPAPPAPSPVPVPAPTPSPAPTPIPTPPAPARPRNTNLPIAQDRVKLARTETMVNLVLVGLDGKYLPELQALEAAVGGMDEFTAEGEVGQIIDRINKFNHNAKAEIAKAKAAKPPTPALPATPAAPATPAPGTAGTPATASAAGAGTPPSGGAPASSAPASGSSPAPAAPSGPKKFLGLTLRVWLWILGALLIPLIGLLIKPYVQDMFVSKDGSTPQTLSSSDYAELQRRRAADHGMTIKGQPGVSMTMTTSQGSNSPGSTVIMTNAANSNNAPQVIGNNNQVLFMSQPTITNIVVIPTTSEGGSKIVAPTVPNSGYPPGWEPTCHLYAPSSSLPANEDLKIDIEAGKVSSIHVRPGWTLKRVSSPNYEVLNWKNGLFIDGEDPSERSSVRKDAETLFRPAQGQGLVTVQVRIVPFSAR